ncbi:hypothetical protein J5N97_021771 [Dioscorea zingiberensis]|uniref:H(+)/Pi cotransporter n=1 Tax=Dioscorea zingiberensis TaxID=325984 RepID=A0A9D5C9J2_9LILI|nr:hypothetical protein J5N97_021771 [Dioscorea zingiberensis]
MTSFLTSFSPNIWVYAFFRFTNGFARSGIGICCLVLSTEAVGRKWRGQVGNYGFLFFTIGFLSLPLIAYPSRHSWRNIYRIISSLPLAYSIFLTPFIFESPRWLTIKGRTDEAMKVLKKLAKLNGRRLPKNLTIINPIDTTSSINSTKKLWSVRWAAKRMIALMVAGFGVGFVYYGVQLNVENLNFNLYFTVVANALMEFPAVFVGSVLMRLMDRRFLFSSASIIAGVSSILCILFPKKKSKHSWAQLGLEAVGFMTASMAYDVLLIYGAELFPTNVRNFASCMLGQTLMLGGAMAPVLVVLGRLSPALSFIVFGGFAIFSGILTVWLPDTRNVPFKKHKKHPSTMEEVYQAEAMEVAEVENGDEEEGGPTETTVDLTVNEIIEQHVGSFGLSQFLQVFLVSLAWMFDAQSTLVTIFTDAQPAWKCKVAFFSCFPQLYCVALSLADRNGLEVIRLPSLAESGTSFVATSS